MRTLITVIALVFAVGVLTPTATEARSPEARKAWGCYFTTKSPGFFTLRQVNGGGFEPDTVEWSATGKLGGCDRERTFIVRVSVWQDVADGPNVRTAGFRHETTVQPRGSGDAWDDFLWGSPKRGCETYYWPHPVEGAPFYLKMIVKRKHHPGRIWLRSSDIVEPCGAHEVPGW